jgi:hypothetical protein
LIVDISGNRDITWVIASHMVPLSVPEKLLSYVFHGPFAR